MSVDVAEVYRNLTRGQAYAQVGVEVARAGVGSLVTAEAALAQITADLDSLKADGPKAPTGLKAVATDALAGLRAEYEAHVASAEDRLAQPESLQRIIGVDVAAEQRRLAVAQAWIAAIDAVGGA